jgi:NhaP-type Na+/H+ or K+/H+ antiporter
VVFVEPQGYLIAFYFLLNIIRFFLIFASYPLIARIGIGTNWREAVFMSYGGLRGGVGIALALSLYAEIGEHFNIWSIILFERLYILRLVSIPTNNCLRWTCGGNASQR